MYNSKESQKYVMEMIFRNEGGQNSCGGALPLHGGRHAIGPGVEEAGVAQPATAKLASDFHHNDVYLNVSLWY